MVGDARREPRPWFAVREHVLRAEALSEQLIRLDGPPLVEPFG